MALQPVVLVFLAAIPLTTSALLDIGQRHPIRAPPNGFAVALCWPLWLCVVPGAAEVWGSVPRPDPAAAVPALGRCFLCCAISLHALVALLAREEYRRGTTALVCWHFAMPVPQRSTWPLRMRDGMVMQRLFMFRLHCIRCRHSSGDSRPPLARRCIPTTS